MEPKLLLLWQWSTLAQIVSALMIAVFFVVLDRSVGRVETRPWVKAWLANLAALFVTNIFWFWQPAGVVFTLIRFAYFFSKTMFVAFLVSGAMQSVHGRVGRGLNRAVLAGIVLYSAIAALALDKIERIGVVQSSILAAFFGGTAIILFSRGSRGSRWLAAGLGIRAAFAAIETVAYGSKVLPGAWLPSARVDLFLAAHSSLAAAAEWVIALGCVLAFYRTIQRELTDLNQALFTSKEVVQGNVDHDSLTGLGNRSALRAVFRQVYSTGATIFFFDLNDFKVINDSYGHQAGDDALKRFAQALQKTFRPEDHVIRYAGDEFVVVAQAAEPSQVLGHIDDLREKLKQQRTTGPDIRFSVGHSYLAVHGDPEAAVKAADEAMYGEKAKKVKRGR